MNLVVIFVRTISRVLEGLILEVTIPFINNIIVKGLYTDYKGDKALLGIYRYILKHIQNLDKTLKQIKRARATIRPKSQFYLNRINIVSFVYNLKGREPLVDKVIKIQNQKTPKNTTKLKGFLRLYRYFYIQVKDFIKIIEPIYYLSKKGVDQYQDSKV